MLISFIISILGEISRQVNIICNVNFRRNFKVNIICNLNFRRNFKTSQETKRRANGYVNVVSSVWGVNRLGLVRWFKLAFGLVRVLVCRHFERRRFGGNWSESGSIFGQTPGMVLYIFFENVRSILVCLFSKSGIYPPYQIKSLKIPFFWCHFRSY